MRFLLAAPLAALLLLGTGFSADTRPHAFRLLVDPAGSTPTKLAWRDGSPPLSLRVYTPTLALSPRGRFAAFGSDYAGDGRLRLVDLVRRRLSRSARVVWWPPGGCEATPLLWAANGRIVAFGECSDAHRTGESVLTVLDAATGRVRSTRRIGNVIRTGHAAGRAVLLASPPVGPVYPGTYAREERLGPARLIRIGRDGSVSQVVLRIRAGWARSRTFNRDPGLAVRGDRAVVVAEGDGAAVVDLRTLRVRYHRLQHSFDARRRRLAPPPIPHEGTDNPSRDLVRAAWWLAGDSIAVTGWDQWTDGQSDQALLAGLKILDARTWTVRTIDPSIGELRLTRSFVLGTGWHGLRVFDRRGRAVQGYFRRHRVWIERVRGDRVRVDVIARELAPETKAASPTRVYDVDLRSRRVHLVGRYGGG